MSDEDERRATQMKVASMSLVAAAVVALAGFGGTLWATRANNKATRSEAAASRRSVAYSAYLGELSKFNELVFDASAWAGRDSKELTQPDLKLMSSYYSQAPDVAADLQTDWTAAMLATPPNDAAAVKYLNGLHAAEQNGFTRFKCSAGIQSAGCEVEGHVVKRGSSTGIFNHLEMWSAKNQELQTKLINATRPALN